MSSLASSQTPAAPAPHGIPWLRLAFRPFYLGAALLAALLVPLWTAVFLGAITWLPTPPPLLWHAHEMLFGFAIAVIVGFLMTAGKTWTGLATPRGPALGLLILLWLSARVASLVAPYAVFAVLDLALLPMVGLIFLRLLIRARNWRNVPLALILLLLSLVNLTFHLSVNDLIDLAPMRSLYAGLAFIVMIECVMAGRVVPFFTTSAIAGLKIETLPWLERSALAATAIGLALWVADWHGGLATVALALAFTLNLVRQWRWYPLATRGRPIVWILHLAYLWLSLGLGLLALAQMGLVPVSIGVHALGVGATGGLIIGMMTRTARGHTGRALTADAPELAAYVLVMAAAVLRVMVPILAPSL
ncbi:MAG: short-chain dehydrogenase, partial [Betaproteobacteria bacterium HGW-Betaproteobacteria-18]